MITQTETNNDFFNIEKSLNGETWYTIYTCDGAGTSSQFHTYSYIDSNAQLGFNYYKIKQTDLNGQYSYSSIKDIKIGTDNTLFEVYPNPAIIDEVSILIKGNCIEPVSITIEDMYGLLFCSGSIEISKSTLLFKLSDICDLVSGTYNISIKGNKIMQNRKIVVK